MCVHDSNQSGSEGKGRECESYLLLLFVFRSSLQHGRNIGSEAQLLESLGDVITGNGLFGFLLGYLVRLRGDEGDELNTAFYEKVTSLFREGHTVGGGENLRDYFLDRGWS